MYTSGSAFYKPSSVQGAKRSDSKQKKKLLSLGYATNYNLPLCGASTLMALSYPTVKKHCFHKIQHLPNGYSY